MARFVRVFRYTWKTFRKVSFFQATGRRWFRGGKKFMVKLTIATAVFQAAFFQAGLHERRSLGRGAKNGDNIG